METQEPLYTDMSGQITSLILAASFLFIVTFLHRIFLHTFFVPPKSSHTHIYIVFFDGSPVVFWCRWAGRQLKGCSSIMKPEHLKILIKSLHFVSVSSKLVEAFYTDFCCHFMHWT